MDGPVSASRRRRLALLGGILVALGSSAPVARAAIEPGLYFDPTEVAVGLQASVREVEVGICDGIRFAIAPEGASVTAWGDGDLIVVDGTRRERLNVDGRTYVEYVFVVPQVEPGIYSGFYDCPAKGGAGPVMNTLNVAPGTWFAPAHTVPGRQVNVQAASSLTKVCEAVRLSLAPDVVPVDDPQDPGLVRVSGKGLGLDTGPSGFVYDRYEFTVPALRPGRYVGYAWCPSIDGVASFGPLDAQPLVVTAGPPETATTAALSRGNDPRWLFVSLAALAWLALAATRARRGRVGR